MPAPAEDMYFRTTGWTIPNQNDGHQVQQAEADFFPFFAQDVLRDLQLIRAGARRSSRIRQKRAVLAEMATCDLRFHQATNH